MSNFFISWEKVTKVENFDGRRIGGTVSTRCGSPVSEAVDGGRKPREDTAQHSSVGWAGLLMSKHLIGTLTITDMYNLFFTFFFLEKIAVQHLTLSHGLQ
jgi:hypothetical protein